MFSGNLCFLSKALDGNNGIYPLAYAVVESETLNSWTWFLSNLGDDLGLGTNSNFTFMSDRQKVFEPIQTRFYSFILLMQLY